MSEPSDPILRLPQHIRLMIYDSVGILNSSKPTKFINLNSKGAPKRSQDKQKYLNSHSLMLTCQTFYEDVSRIVYSSNHFHVRPDKDGSLRALRQLTNTSVEALKLLTIHLNVTSCGLGAPSDDRLHPWDRSWSKDQNKTRSVAPLRAGERRSEDLLREWRSTWYQTLRPNVTRSGCLALDLVCDVDDSDCGLHAVTGLIESKNSLAQCSVRLSRWPDQSLINLAERAATAATGEPKSSTAERGNESSSPFRFLDLPTELRQHILSFTDLVTPVREVEWNPKNGMYFRYEFNIFRTTFFWSEPNALHGTQYDPSSPPDQNRFSWMSPAHRYRGCWHSTALNGCFCRKYHSAYSTAHTCTCWASPTSIFLVSRAIQRDAMQIFYSQNRFVIVPPSGTTWLPEQDDSLELPISQFLESAVPHDALRHLRFLEVVFGPVSEGFGCNTWCPAFSTKWRSWVKALRFSRQHLNLSRLTLRLYFPAWLPMTGDGEGPFDRTEMNAEEKHLVHRNCMDLVAPLRHLYGLQNLHVHISDPMWYYEGQSTQHKAVLGVEREAEARAMWNGYDAFACGKGKSHDSRWLEEYNDKILGR